MTIYTVSLEADTGAGVVTFYAATDGFNTGPSDTPPNQHFRPTLKVPPNFERSLFRGGGTTGAPEIGFGEIHLVNADGRYDAWPDFAFDGRPCVVKAVERSGEAYASAMVLIRGRVESVDVTDVFRTLRLRLYDPLVDLDRPLLVDSYGGTTNGGGQGADGTEALKSTLKPRVYGVRVNLAPTNVNPFDLVYQVSDRAVAEIVVYDGGLGLANAGDEGSVGALVAASIPPGSYRTCRALGLFRLGGTPARTITADVAAGAPVDRSAARVVRAILLDAGVPAASLDTASFDTLHQANPAPVGFRAQGDGTVLAAVSEVLRAIGGWLIVTAQGLLQVGRFEAPSNLPVASFAEWQATGDIERVAAGSDDTGIPTWRVVVRYGRLGVVQNDGDLVGAVSPARRAALAVEWREAVAQDAAIQGRWLNARVLTVEAGLASEADAQAEANRLLALFRGKRSLWRIRLDTRFALGVELGETVRLQLGRFLPAGANFVVIGRVDDTSANRVQLSLWG